MLEERNLRHEARTEELNRRLADYIDQHGQFPSSGGSGGEWFQVCFDMYDYLHVYSGVGEDSIQYDDMYVYLEVGLDVFCGLVVYDVGLDVDDIDLCCIYWFFCVC